MFFRPHPTKFPRYASPPDEITKLCIAQRVFKQMTRKLAQMKEGKQGYRLVKPASSLVESSAHNRAVCSKNVLNFKNRLLDDYISYRHSE